MSVSPLAQIFTSGLGAVGPLGLAVSGGGDSMAMLHLAHQIGLKPQIATVDHGLRPESAFEARMVAGVAAKMGLRHDTLHWRGWDGQGNLQDQARRARKALLTQWAKERGLAAVALAHTCDDLAETFLMRLARGAGIDGLSAMQTRWSENGIVFLRPLLAARRDDLRAYLTGIAAQWVDDPSNEMDRFDRVKIRKTLALLDPLGIDARRLADVAGHISVARTALDHGTDDLIRQKVTGRAGILSLATAIFDAPLELQRRLLQRVILWLHPHDYAPRGDAITALQQRLRQGMASQLAGCHFLPFKGKILAFREANTLSPQASFHIWDHVWQVNDPPQNTVIAALGPSGLSQWQGWRAVGFPRAALLSQPSLWRDDALISTPLMTPPNEKPVFFRAKADNCLDDLNLSH